MPEDYHRDFHKIFQENLTYVQREGEDVSTTLPPEGDTPEKGTVKSVVMGSPRKESIGIAFVVMPFGEKTTQYPKGFFDEVLKQLIVPAGVQAGFKVETANKKGSDVIQSTIINDLCKADLVICDLTDHNPNALFELGWRIAIDRPVALIRAKGTPAIFDVDHMLRVYDYNSRLWPLP